MIATAPGWKLTTVHRHWLIVGLLGFGSVIAYLDRANISVALATRPFTEFFRLTDSDRGTLNSAFFWSYALLQLPAGWIVDRFGVRRPFAIAILAWSAVSALTSAAATIWQLVLVRVLLGVAESVVTPASLAWIRYHIREERRALAIGTYQAGTKVGSAIGPPLTAWLILWIGWRGMFVAIAAAGAVWLIPWLKLVQDDVPREGSSKVHAAPAQTFARLMSKPAMWGIVTGTFSYSYFGYFSMTWLPAYLVDRRHLSVSLTGLYSMYSFGGMAIMTILAGWAADRIIARGHDPVTVRKAFILSGFVLGCTELIGARSESLGVSLFFAVFSLTGLGLASANYWALTQTLMPGAAIGRIGAIQNCASNLAGIAAPVITGLLKSATGNYDAAMEAVAMFLVAGIVSYSVLVRKKYAVETAIRKGEG